MIYQAGKSIPIVSVIMPVYNGGRHLREAIERIFAQSFIGFELIIINDGSTDETADIINGYRQRDNRIKAYYQEHQ